MVKALHAAGLEVILDVVYNHTAEGSPLGPTLSFRGLDDIGYYKHVDWVHDGATYFDVTGCGNTVDAAHPPALRMILDSLRYWVTEMHVDGFRFDLTPALTRTGHRVDLRGHFITTIGQDPVLRHVKLIAEPWDASMDGYQVGRFPPPWCEWNDKYRDTVRDFWRLDSGGIRDIASRLAGSSDLYADDGRSPYASVNFVTAHDGFTLRDLVSYDHKHNEANLEQNRDGTDNNRSWNCGVEGETTDPHVVALRHKQAANLLATLCLSTGVPMITAGDERGRTQRGNNNAYVQDNEVSWMDWRPDDAWLDLYDVATDRPAAAARAPGTAAAALPGGPADRRGRPEGPRLDPPRGPGDDRGRLVRRPAAHVRDVRLRRPAAGARAAGRAAARLVVPAVLQRARRTRQGHDPAQPVGQRRRGGAEHRRRAPDRRAGLGRRGARHRAALDDRAPPALTGRPRPVRAGCRSGAAHAVGSATRPSSASAARCSLRGSTRTVYPKGPDVASATVPSNRWRPPS